LLLERKEEEKEEKVKKREQKKNKRREMSYRVCPFLVFSGKTSIPEGVQKEEYTQGEP